MLTNPPLLIAAEASFATILCSLAASQQRATFVLIKPPSQDGSAACSQITGCSAYWCLVGIAFPTTRNGMTACIVRRRRIRVEDPLMSDLLIPGMRSPHMLICEGTAVTCDKAPWVQDSRVPGYLVLS